MSWRTVIEASHHGNRTQWARDKMNATYRLSHSLERGKWDRTTETGLDASTTAMQRSTTLHASNCSPDGDMRLFDACWGVFFRPILPLMLILWTVRNENVSEQGVPPCTSSVHAHIVCRLSTHTACVQWSSERPWTLITTAELLGMVLTSPTMHIKRHHVTTAHRTDVNSFFWPETLRQTDTHGFMLNRSRTAMLALGSRVRFRSVETLSFVQVMWTRSGPASSLLFITAWAAVFLSWMSWAW